MAAARPLVTVQQLDDASSSKDTVKLPSVLTAPIRPDIVRDVHTSMAKNRRQAYAVNVDAGHQHSAESWGTGRAVSRIPRVSGGGTSRAGQGAFGNMCRKGRMFAPTKTWRKWHRRINTNQKRFATASALAASALPALLEARGHRISGVNEVPLVVPASVEAIKKTKEAVAVLQAVGAYEDVEKVKDSRNKRAGKGKMRGRRFTQRRGPLVVFKDDKGLVKAFRNLPGVELANVERLNLLQLAPGGHVGRFIIWTKPAFEALEAIWGSTKRLSEQKKGYKIPYNMMTNTDITRIINSDEVQSKLRAPITRVRRAPRKKNPLKNLGALVRLNPFALSQRRSMLLAQERRAAQKAAAIAARRAGNPIADDAATTARKAADKKHRPNKKQTYQRIARD